MIFMYKQTSILLRLRNETFRKIKLKKVLFEDLNKKRLTWEEFIEKAVLDGINN